METLTLGGQTYTVSPETLERIKALLKPQRPEMKPYDFTKDGTDIIIGKESVTHNAIALNEKRACGLGSVLFPPDCPIYGNLKELIEEMETAHKATETLDFFSVPLAPSKEIDYMKARILLDAKAIEMPLCIKGEISTFRLSFANFRKFCMQGLGLCFD